MKHEILIKLAEKHDTFLEFKLKLAYTYTIRDLIKKKINEMKENIKSLDNHETLYLKNKIISLNNMLDDYLFYNDMHSSNYLNFGCDSISDSMFNSIEETTIFYDDSRNYYKKFIFDIIIDKEKQSRLPEIIDAELNTDYDGYIKTYIYNEITRLDNIINSLI